MSCWRLSKPWNRRAVVSTHPGRNVSLTARKHPFPPTCYTNTVMRKGIPPSGLRNTHQAALVHPAPARVMLLLSISLSARSCCSFAHTWSAAHTGSSFYTQPQPNDATNSHRAQQRVSFFNSCCSPAPSMLVTHAGVPLDHLAHTRSPGSAARAAPAAVPHPTR